MWAVPGERSRANQNFAITCVLMAADIPGFYYGQAGAETQRRSPTPAQRKTTPLDKTTRHSCHAEGCQ